MISRKVPKDANLQSIIAQRTISNNEQIKQKNTVISVKSRSTESSPYASIGAMDPHASDIEKKQFLSEVKNAKHMDDDFFGKSTKFIHKTFDDKYFNADKPLPTREKIIEPEKPVINNSRINVLSEFNNI